MPDGRAARFVAILASFVVAVVLVRWPAPVVAAGSIPSPEQFIGFKTGTDNKLARWDRIVEYMKTIAAGSDRVRLRELGRTNLDDCLTLDSATSFRPSASSAGESSPGARACGVEATAA